VEPKLCGFSSKGDYLSWDEFITRTPQFKEHKQAAWFVLKLRRNLETVDKLFAYDTDGKLEFLRYSPSSLMAKIHKIERLSTLKHLELGVGNRQGFLSASLIMEEAITSAQLEGAATTRPVAKEMLSTGREPR
ncbi:Fic family protein, partial [Vibrio sp. 10N.261.45.A4]